MTVHTVLFGRDDDTDKLALKLHRQFAHPTADRLKGLLSNAGRTDKKLFDSVVKVTLSCPTCQRYRKPKSRPVVSMPMSSTFNETVSAVLKSWNGVYFFVMVDMCSRYCQAVVIRNKLSETIIQAFSTHWICLFGALQRFLTNNDGEFSNGEMIALADRFGIKLLNTAAASPWSNGTCERLNAILGIGVHRVTEDAACSL